MLLKTLANMSMTRNYNTYTPVNAKDVGSPFRLVYIAEGDANIRDLETFRDVMNYIKDFATDDQMLCLIQTGAYKGGYNDYSNELYYTKGVNMETFLAKIVGSVVKKDQKGVALNYTFKIKFCDV